MTQHIRQISIIEANFDSVMKKLLRTAGRAKKHEQEKLVLRRKLTRIIKDNNSLKTLPQLIY